MVTIKELSDAIGVSKVGVSKWIERNGYKDRLQKIGNKYFIPADVEQVIRANFDNREPKPQKAMNSNEAVENAVTSELIALLREQLESKDREIERLHNQIENLQKINADTIKALRESNTLQAMQLTDGSEVSDRAGVENIQRNTRGDQPGVENIQRTESEQRETVSFWDRIRRTFRR